MNRAISKFTLSTWASEVILRQTYQCMGITVIKNANQEGCDWKTHNNFKVLTGPVLTRKYGLT